MAEGYQDSKQDSDLVGEDLRRQQAMETDRAPWETIYRDVEAFVDPVAAGGFSGQASGGMRGQGLFDMTAIRGLSRFDAALGAVTTPKNQRWHGLTVLNKDLAKLPPVRLWLEHATDRLFQCRYAPHVGAGVQFSQDRRQLGLYGSGPLLVDDWVGRGLYYRAIHMSECYIDEDFRGRIDTVHRKFTYTARQAKQSFGEDALPEKIRQACYDPNKRDTKFDFLHVIRPNEKVEVEKFDWRGKPIASRYLAVDEKYIVRQGGYHTMPISVSRNVTSPQDKYGRSPSMETLGSVKGLNQMVKTILRAGHKMVDPALAFYDDGDISKLVTKPGGLNPGLVDEAGRLLVAAVPGGGDVRFGFDLLESERGPVRDAFLEDFFKILTDPSDRMTATQVLEMVAKQGVLIQPFADRYETEKLGVMIERELDILLREGQIDPMPPEMLEAGAAPLVVMTNPLAKMARSQEAAAFTRWVEIGVQAAGAGRPDALDRINFDVAMPDVGDVLGVRPSWIVTDEDLEAARQDKAQQEAVAQTAAVVPEAAGAALDLAKANDISGGAIEGAMAA
jgi:Bacteriophage head to tail connecting protein